MQKMVQKMFKNGENLVKLNEKRGNYLHAYFCILGESFRGGGGGLQKRRNVVWTLFPGPHGLNIVGIQITF